MESAIPDHLVTKRRCPLRMRDGFEPPYPSFVARHHPSVERVVMAYFGLQLPPTRPEGGEEKLETLARAFSEEEGPGHSERAYYVDEAGHPTQIAIAYWDRPEVFDGWFGRHGVAWTRAEGGPHGTFTEIVRPAVSRYETLFSSSDRAEGIACLAATMSGTVREHAYWGGMRDRIPLSQTDLMSPRGAPRLERVDGVERVVPHDNLCLIRSGQDWSGTDAEERRMYLDDVEPVLRTGMEFLRDEGLSCGCFANRYMRVVGSEGGDSEKAFAMSWWRSLEDLENWAESHATHVAIFAAAMRHLSRLGPAAKLRLYHEVTVAGAEEQFFEYRNCHPQTGMLRVAR